MAILEFLGTVIITALAFIGLLTVIVAVTGD